MEPDPKRFRGPSLKSGQLIIFDWDDTLLATTALRRENFVPRQPQTPPRPPQDITPEMKTLLETLGEEVVLTLNLSRDLGTVMIITNGSQDWVDVSCRSFLPACYEDVRSIPKISAKKRGKPFSNDPLQWKRVTFLQETLTYFAESEQGDTSSLSILSVGDSNHERVSTFELAPLFPNHHLKSIHMLRVPTIEDLILQHRLLRRLLPKAISYCDERTFRLDLMMDTGDHTQRALLFH
ncbi:MAG: uncharacterized protein KVP18_004218 [Porospora cf. gigantea A]|uniref:uncharacterized protein n=1 Tax=Porospora cf. gigantea A TaxID=2853593 RepID=UPI00355AC766|nr:MAG: hypothetical protein KVP18_004218 [Porospora cf. gigantea A]